MPVVGFIAGLGVPELLIVLVLVLILFGAGRLPQVFESFGKGIRAFRQASQDTGSPLDIDEDPKQLAKADHVTDAEEVTTKQNAS